MSSNRTYNFISNVKFGFLNKITVLILNFINRTLLIYLLGIEYLGISGLFSDLLMFLTLTDMGFNTAMVYSFYRPLAKKDTKKIIALIQFYGCIYKAIAFVVAAIGLCLLPFLKYIINLDKNIPYVHVYYLIFLANTVTSYLFVYKSTIIVADQKNYILSKYSVIVSILKLAIQSIILFIYRNYIIYLLVMFISTIIYNLLISKKAQQLYPYIEEKIEDILKEEKKEIYNNIKAVFLYKVSGVLMNGTDNTLISILVGTIYVGIYSNYLMLINTVNSFIDIVYTSVTAGIGEMIVKENEKKRYEIFKQLQIFSLVTTFFSTVCIANLINDFIILWIGKSYILDKYILTVILVNFYLAGILHPLWTYREAAGLYLKTKYIMVICGALNLILSLIGGYLWGIVGILTASAVSRLITYAWYEPKLLFKKYFNEKVSRYFTPILVNVPITIGSILIIKYFCNAVVVDSWISFALKSFVVIIASLCIIILTYWNDKYFKELMGRISSWVIKNKEKR